MTVDCASVYRQREPVPHLKHGTINEGGLPDDKSVAITLMRKMVAYKANWYLLPFDGRAELHSGTVCFIRHIRKSV
jgi:chlorite dismutase